MKNNNDYSDIDKAITKQVMEDFNGEAIIDIVCPSCNGSGGHYFNGEFNTCDHCMGAGHYEMEY